MYVTIHVRLFFSSGKIVTQNFGNRHHVCLKYVSGFSASDAQWHNNHALSSCELCLIVTDNFQYNCHHWQVFYVLGTFAKQTPDPSSALIPQVVLIYDLQPVHVSGKAKHIYGDDEIVVQLRHRDRLRKFR